MNIPYPPEHYYQNQGMVPKTGPVECVTTSVVMVMNMLKDRLAHDLNMPALPDIQVKDYAAKLDGLRLGGLRYRLSTNSRLAFGRGWMHPVWQAPAALRQFARVLEQKYGCSFRVKQTVGNSLEDIEQALQAGNFVLVHGLWQVPDTQGVHYRFGGMPHTMLPVEIDRQADRLLFLNPSEPGPWTVDPEKPATFPAPVLYAMPTREFLAFWGRKSLLNLYTRPFTMTVVIPDTNKASKE